MQPPICRSWASFLTIVVPNPIFFVTTRKANGAPNANLNSWGLIGEKGNFSSLVALLDNSHTYGNILREGEWCVCFPAFQHYHQCVETIRLNAPDNDEITDAGFTVELPKTVQAPRIAECSVNLECRLEWHHPLYENSRWHLFAWTSIACSAALSPWSMAPRRKKWKSKRSRNVLNHN